MTRGIWRLCRVLGTALGQAPIAPRVSATWRFSGDRNRNVSNPRNSDREGACYPHKPGVLHIGNLIEINLSSKLCNCDESCCKLKYVK